MRLAMDESLRDVLLATIPIVGGIVVAVLVAKITADRSMDLERAKWKRGLYATLLHESDSIRDAVHGILDGFSNQGWASGIAPAQKALAEIKILSPGIAPLAAALWDATGALMKGVLHLDAATAEPEGIKVPIDREAWPPLDAAYLAARRAFIDAAAKELG